MSWRCLLHSIVIFARARAAYEADPKKFNHEDYGERILVRIEKDIIRPGTRRGEKSLSHEEVEKKLKGCERSALRLLTTF